MYLQYFGLNEAPFSITPDPAFVYLSPEHREALAHLMYGVGQGGSGGFHQLSNFFAARESAGANSVKDTQRAHPPR